MSVELTQSLLAQAAGWEAVKTARGLLASGRVLSSNWTPPLLKGVVQAGATSYRAGLLLKSVRDIENLCTCRPSREWGTICSHSVAVGLHHLAKTAPEPAPATTPSRKAPAPSPTTTERRLQRASAGQPGEPAALHFIFPPNLAQALAKGRVMLCLEASWAGGRCPLNTLPASRSYQFSAQDLALLDALERLAGGSTPALLMTSVEDLQELLPRMIGHERVTLGKARTLTISAEAWPCAVQACLEPNGEILLSWPPEVPRPLTIGKHWGFQDDTMRPIPLPAHCADMLTRPIRISREQVPDFLSRDWPTLTTACRVSANFQPGDFQITAVTPRFLLHLRGGLAELHAHLQCAYGARILTPGQPRADETTWLPDPTSPVCYGRRDLTAERSALAVLLGAGFSAPDDRSQCHLYGQDKVLNFFARLYPRLQRQWQVSLEERLERSARQNLETITPRFEVQPSGVQWFDLSVSYQASGGEVLPQAEIQRLLLSGRGYTRLRNGKLAVLDTGAVEELQEVLTDCAPRQIEGRYRINQAQAGFIEATLRQQDWQVQAPAAWRDRAAAHAGAVPLPCPALGPLESVLRPYQKAGVAWLAFLRAHGFGGLLADEMGLGKTVQVLAHLRTVRNSSAETSLPPSLVICPTSLVSNWIAEAAKFAPELRVLAIQGPDRQAHFHRIPHHDLVVTSYALVRRDLESYRGLTFDTVVLDEAQHIKNRQTQNARAVKSISAAHRIVLTGTPMENSVLDLWSIFDFLMPGYLGSARDFRERYEIPMTSGPSPEVAQRLGRRLRPFLLRRLKQEVAADLPPRLEQVAYCDMAPAQETLYRQILETARAEIIAATGPDAARGRITALNALLRLRQVCCDPRLLHLERETDGPCSGKLDMFRELVDEVLDGGHRVLVFSQFVAMLALLRAALEESQIEYCYLDGSTTNRPDVIARFQQSQIPVFLISLKAGGTGLNLTGADTVIHFDPWWNPAVEDQATDRAHRLGQTRAVTSYKLITRGTVEEKILALQRRKRELIQTAVGGETQLLEALTWEEIRELFS